MSVSELANTPIDITLAGKSYKVKRLSVNDIFGLAESKVKSNYISDMQTVASFLNGAEKTSYLIQATKDIPKGEKLNTLATEWLETPVGMAELLYAGLTKCQSVSQDEIAQAILLSTDEEKNILVSYLSGNDISKVDSSKVEDNSKKN